VEVRYLGLDVILVIASATLGIEAGVLATMADLVTADMAINAPAASFGGSEFYPDFPTKVGVLGYRLARHHAFPDGNKRIAFLAMVEFVERNGGTWTVHSEDRTVEMMIAAAAGSVTEDQFIRWVGEEIS